jgi:hypothetical protein
MATRWTKVSPGYKACNTRKIAASIRRARKMPIAADLKPLRRHLLRLAADSARRGACQRAGHEVGMATKLARKHPS